MEPKTLAVMLAPYGWWGACLYSALYLVRKGSCCNKISGGAKILEYTHARVRILHEALSTADLFASAATVLHVEVLHPVAEQTPSAHAAT